MPRIAGVDIPREKQIWVSLQYIYGIGQVMSRKILTKTGVSPETKADDLTEGELAKIRDIIDKEYTVEGELRTCQPEVNAHALMPAHSAVLVRP
jgi:small subunit ribosomal protein S13